MQEKVPADVQRTRLQRADRIILGTIAGLMTSLVVAGAFAIQAFEDQTAVPAERAAVEAGASGRLAVAR